MSPWIDVTADCPACGEATPMRSATSVHIARVPEIRTAVLERTLHRATCRCGHELVVDTAFTYVDVERGHWIQVEPDRRRPDWAAVEAHTMRALTRGLDLTSPIISGLAENARRRVVFGIEELREKLVVWDAGIDDGLLECIKLRAWIDMPALMRASLLADRVTDDGGLELVRSDARRFAVPASWVDRALDEQPSLAARYPELFRGGFVYTLRLIAIVVLVLAGCSQPHAHEAPPPRPRDAAAPVMIDAGVADADPADAPEHVVSWKDMRDRVRESMLSSVAAQVLRVEWKNGESLIELDRGEAWGVRVGWNGRLLDTANHRVFEVFEITRTGPQRSQALIRANPDELARTSMHAVLWDSVSTEP